MEPGGEHLDHDLVLLTGDRVGELLVTRRVVEGPHDCGIHLAPPVSI
jgi:hypothetical protein